MADADWSLAESSLIDRGWLVPAGGLGAGTLTGAGRVAHEDIERRTDDAAASPWAALGPPRTAQVGDLLDTLVAPIVAAGVIPPVNPIGVPLPRR